MKKFVVFLVTILGTASGFAGGWLLAKKKYEKLADEEIESVKKYLNEYYDSKDNTQTAKQSKKMKVEIKDSIINETKQQNVDYAKQYKSSDANNKFVDIPSGATGIRNFGLNRPYVITPEDYNESSNKSVTLWYTDDKVLCDDDGNEIRDYENMIGSDEVFQHFGEYEADSVFVRNDAQGIDYEILLDHKLYYKTTPTNRFVVDEEDED